MADHFEEVVNLRLHQLDERIDDEANAVKEHFEEFKTFVTESLNTQTAQLRAEFKAELGPMKTDIATLKTEVAELKTDVFALKADFTIMRTDISVLKGDVAGLRREFGRFEEKMDARFDATHVVLREILNRLPPAANA